MNFLRIIYLFLFILAISCFSSHAFSESTNIGDNNKFKQLKYIFTYFKNNEKSILNVSLTFKSGPEEKTTLALPSHSGGVDELFKNITDMTATGARIEKTKNPNEIILFHSPNQIVTLNYNVRQGWDGPLSSFPNFLAPIFQKDYFQFIGNGVLIYPQSYEKEKKITILFDWNIPKGWKIANSYGNKNRHQEVITNLDDALQGLFISGNYRFYKISVEGGTISTGIRGKWPFQEREFSKTVANIINNERKFWNDYSFPHFLVSLIPIETDNQGMAGTAMTSAFATVLKSNFSLKYPVWYLIAHECFHTWNKPELFDVSDGNQVYLYYYWFTEGFTDYYAHLLNLRLGLITLPDYIKQYNETLVDYYSSPVNTSTIEQVKENFWKDFDTQRLPYQQGVILANNWNVQIKQATNNQNSLDDLMHSLITFVKEGTKLTLDNMNKIAEKYKKEKLIEDIHNIYSGHLVISSEHSLGPCVYQISKMLAPYNPGFDINTSKEKHLITSVNAKSRAFAAGLRNGQIMISIEDHPDDISQMIKITIKENDEIKVIKYYPYKGELKSITQFVLDQTKWETQPDKCLAWFK